MMTKTIRKVVSILCVVALIMSLGAVAFSGTSSAAEAPATTTKVYNGVEDGTTNYWKPNNTKLLGGTVDANGYNITASTKNFNWGVTDPRDRSHVLAVYDPDYDYVQFKANTTYLVTVKYIVKSVESTSYWSNLAIGYSADSTAPGTKKSVGAFKFTEQYRKGHGSINTEQTIEAKIDGTANAGKWLYLFVDNYSATAITVKSVTVTEMTNAGGASVVSFNTMGGNAIEKKLYASDMVASLPTPTTSDSTMQFAGWYLDEACTNAVPANYTPAADVTLYAKWKLGDVNREMVFNGVKDGTTEYWTPNNTMLLQGSVDNKGYHINASTKSFSWTTGVASRTNIMAVYDPDYGYVQFKADTRYIITVDYAINSVASNSYWSSVNIGYSEDSTAPGSKNKAGAILEGTYVPQKAPIGSFTMQAVVNGSDYENKWLYIYVDNYSATSVTVKSVTVKEVRDSNGVALIKYDTNGGDKLSSDLFVKNSVVALPTPTHSDTNKGFAGWYFDAACTNAVPANFAPTADTTLYAKWTVEAVNVTFVNNGKRTTKRLGVGVTLPRAERPIAETFFEAWCTDTNLTEVITKVPDYNLTVYARYNVLYTEFNEAGASGSVGSGTADRVVDPDDSTNFVLRHHAADNCNMYNFEIPIGDFNGASAYVLRTNTTYKVSYKVKVAPTPASVSVHLYAGTTSAITASETRTALGSTYTFAEGTLTENGSEWVTVNTQFTTGNSLYLDRVNWTWADNLYFCVSTRKAADAQQFPSSANNRTPNVYLYFDDIKIVPEVTEVPEGAVAVHFQTNGEEIPSLLGYPGENIIMPKDPVLSGHKFIGWYTDSKLTKAFPGTTFPSETTTLYAKWELTEWKMNFETEYVTTTMSARFNLVTEGGNTYLRYNYEQGNVNSTSIAADYGRATFNLGDSEPYYATEGVTYTIKFKYKVVESDGQTGIKGISSAKFNTWQNGLLQSGGLLLNTASNKWQEGQFTVSPTGMYHARAMGFAVNGDATVLFDDFVITADINLANVYGDAIIMFNTNGSGDAIDPIGGNIGDKIGKLPTISRSNYVFKGWYTDANCTKKFAGDVYEDETTTLYAGWALKSLSENFEKLPAVVQTRGISGVYNYYTERTIGFDAANVKDGASSVFRNGAGSGTRGFTLCRDASMTLDPGSEYTITMYIKPTNVTDPNGTINVISMTSSNGITKPKATDAMVTVGNLKVGEWQQVTYTFTAKDKYIGISTTEGNDIYFDAVKVNLKGYVGTDTGDNSVSPIIITLLVVVACGALVITYKKVFNK